MLHFPGRGGVCRRDPGSMLGVKLRFRLPLIGRYLLSGCWRNLNRGLVTRSGSQVARLRRLPGMTKFLLRVLLSGADEFAIRGITKQPLWPIHFRHSSQAGRRPARAGIQSLKHSDRFVFCLMAYSKNLPLGGDGDVAARGGLFSRMRVWVPFRRLAAE